MTVEAKGRALKVISWDYTAIEYILPPLDDRFHPCRHLDGKSGTVRLFEDREDGSQRLLGVLVASPR